MDHDWPHSEGPHHGTPHPAGPFPDRPFVILALVDADGQVLGRLSAPVDHPLWQEAMLARQHHDRQHSQLLRPHGRDPRARDELGVLPTWAPDAREPWKKGQSKACFIWPRDKHTKSPLRSWTRWKDLLSGKGPPMYIGNRTEFAPTKDQWSRWVELDNFGYRSGERHISQLPPNRKYDFRTRRFTDEPWRDGVWSGVRRDGGADGVPCMIRDAWGNEWTSEVGWIPHDRPWLNRYRYNPRSATWDYLSPSMVVV